MSNPSPSLASLIAAVRATPALASWVEPMADADIAEVIRTARTTKGAIWLATRAAGPVATDGGDDEQRALTALRCLAKLATKGDPRAVAAMAAWDAAEVAALDAADLTAD